jgi:hypothetical protein
MPFFAVFKITLTQEERNIRYILKIRENKTGHLTKAGKVYNKIGNVRINVTLRHFRATNVAVGNQSALRIPRVCL